MIQTKWHYTTSCRRFLYVIGWTLLWGTSVAGTEPAEWIHACVWDAYLADQPSRDKITTCLGWRANPSPSFCRGHYAPLPSHALPDPHAIELRADRISFQPSGQSDLHGHVQVQQDQGIVTARTARVYRNEQTHQIDRIDLDYDVHLMDPERLMVAQHGSFNPQDKSGYVQKAIYRFNTNRAAALLPAWGTAEWIRRFANQNYDMHKVTYTTCSPQEDGWQILAKDLHLDHAKETGVARKAVLRLGKVPILYTPYLSFPTSSKRKSGFLMPMGGYTNVSGFDFGWPYYLNLAPNYDVTLTPHYYSLRGWMGGGTTRFLTERSSGIVGGSILPKDSAMKTFIEQNVQQYPSLLGTSTDRWSVLVREKTSILPNLNFDIDYQQVSDDYYLQDFSTNLAMSSENQLLRRGSLVFTSEHWLIGSLAQSYQTLHPINQSVVADIYDRLPQVLADGAYHDLPLGTDVHVLGQFDYFRWPGLDQTIPQGARYHLNPILSVPRVTTWGYITPSVEMVENNYGLAYNTNPSGLGVSRSESFNRLLPRGYIDSGLVFERDNAHWLGHRMRQTLEPRLFYLNVPFVDQSQFPAFDSAYMIFNTDQLFRTNRFSGFDRISDANQLAYAATTRWLSPNTGQEKVKLTVGQIHYFSPRKVQLCYAQTGECTDNPLFLGYVSPTAAWSPVAMNGVYTMNSAWSASTDYVWDPATRATNNANVNLHYQLSPERILRFGYNYLVSGNVIAVTEAPLNNRPLNQITGSYAWPLTENWSSLGIYSYNLSEGYNMVAFLGLQYDSCCWAARLIGGQTFKSLGPDTITPQYNNNIYLQIILKGLGSVATSNPATTIQSYLPGYRDVFQHR